MRVELLTKDEKTMRKVCNDHKFRWAVAINGHDYDFYGARGDVSVHEIAELVATFIQATGYNYSLNITAEAVKTLREQTGWGMMDCKSALVEADGDMNKAQEVLRKKNGGQALGHPY